MNERIKDLAIQAGGIWRGGYVEQPNGDSIYAEQKSVDPVDMDLNKFAELIVRECAELIDNKVTITAAQTYDEVFVAVYDTNFANAKKIKEHFGVEE